MKVSLALVLLLAAASGVRSADPPKNDSPGAYECAWENPDKPGEKYDLLPMMNNEKDYTFTSKDSTGNVLNYWVNPCRATITSICGSNSATCQQWDPTRDDGKASLGSTTTAKIIGQNLDEQKEKGGFTIEFTGGTTAQPSGQARQMEIDFICDPTGDGMGTPEYSGEQPALHYNIKWTTKMACPSESGDVTMWIVLGAATGGLLLACVVGIGIVLLRRRARRTAQSTFSQLDESGEDETDLVDDQPKTMFSFRFPNFFSRRAPTEGGERGIDDSHTHDAGSTDESGEDDETDLADGRLIEMSEVFFEEDIPTGPQRGSTQTSLGSLTPTPVLSSRTLRMGAMLGSGSFGDVLSCKIGTAEYAVKLFRMRGVQADVETAFRAEMSLMSDLKHANIVRFVGWFEQSQNFGLVMEKMDSSLEGQLHKRREQEDVLGWFSEPDAIFFGVQIARGLAFLHGRRIAHRDIKPGNVLVSLQGLGQIKRVCLTDFGVSKVFDSSETAGFSRISHTLAGTVGYIAPEVFTPPSDPFAADIFSVGAVMFEVATGMPPSGANMVMQLERAISPNYAEAKARWRTWANVRRLHSCCCALDPTERPSAKELAELFENAFPGTPDNLESRLAQRQVSEVNVSNL